LSVSNKHHKIKILRVTNEMQISFTAKPKFRQ